MTIALAFAGRHNARKLFPPCSEPPVYGFEDVWQPTTLLFKNVMDEDDLTAEPHRGSNIAGLTFVFEIGLAVLAVILGRAFGPMPLRSVDPNPAAMLRPIAWGLLATVPMLLGLLLLEWRPRGPFAELRRIVHQNIVPMFSGAKIWQLGLIAIAAGVGEEMLFRGFLQTAIADRIGTDTGLWMAVAITSGLFGICHWVTRTYAVLATFIGAYLGWLLLACGNLIVPISAHAAYDFVALLYLVKVAPQSRNQRQAA